MQRARCVIPFRILSAVAFSLSAILYVLVSDFIYCVHYIGLVICMLTSVFPKIVMVAK